MVNEDPWPRLYQAAMANLKCRTVIPSHSLGLMGRILTSLFLQQRHLAHAVKLPIAQHHDVIPISEMELIRVCKKARTATGPDFVANTDLNSTVG